MKEKLLVIDGSSILFRAYYALPEMMTSTGMYTNGVLGFLNILFRALDIVEPTQIAIAFDLPGPTFRNEIYEDYKGNRSATPEDLKPQFEYIKEILSAMDYTVLELEGYEADDIAGTLSKQGTELGDIIFLLTGDKDYLQLVNDNTKVLYTVRGVSELGIYDIDKVVEEYDISPNQFVDMLGLMGDPSDNIPGISGVGVKTAVKLLKEFGSIDNLYKNTDKLRDNKTNQRIKDSEDVAKMSRDLARIDVDTPIDIDREGLSIGDFDEEKVSEVMAKYELNSLMERIGLERPDNKIEVSDDYTVYNDRDIDEVISKIKEAGRFSLKLITEGRAHLEGQVKMTGIGVGEDIYILKGDYVTDLKDVLEDESVEVQGYDIKEDILYMIARDVQIKNYDRDIVIGEYILDPVNNDSRLDKLSTKYNLGLFIEISDLKANEKKEVYTWDEELQEEYLSSVLVAIDKVGEDQEIEIESQNMTDLYENIELPLVEILADMEYTGVSVDRDMLVEIGEDLEVEIDVVVDKIHELAGVEFNVNSPKQLGEVLFERLELPVVKRTKTGYSTNVDVLNELKDKHDIIPYILRYRTIAKLKSTYVDGFLPLIGEDGKIHSEFHQTVTATGRLSSTNPNLQNIPIRTEDGRVFRKIFTASGTNKLVDADYSQIELRLLGDISKDETMIQSFKNGEDIHKTTAAKVFGLDPDQVTPEKRSDAKAVNFGMVYGVSAFGLSENINVSRAKAQEYIDNYFDRFSGVAKYMKDIVKTAKDQGYVDTMFGRRRYLPELESRNWNVRNFGERIALNMPIQGTAADIIKLAMIGIYHELKFRDMKSKLILQIHDELIVDTHLDEIDEVKEIVKTQMENVVNLSVPLIADIGVGESWYEA